MKKETKRDVCGKTGVMDKKVTRQSFSEMLVAVAAICGQHELDEEVQMYVERVLGKQNEEA